MLYFALSCCLGPVPLPLHAGEKVKADTERLKAHVRVLSSITPARNHANPTSINMAAEYIIREFKAYGYKSSQQAYKVGKSTYRNIIASYNTEKKTRIIIGAHYDVCGDQPGADDNASGIAGLLELARLVMKYRPEINYRVDFAAYPLEEPPYFATESMGSFVHAKSLSGTKTDVRLMVALEMLGYFTDEDDSQEYPSRIMKLFYPERGNFIAVVGRLSDASYIDRIASSLRNTRSIPVETLRAPEILSGVDFSDHRNFWKFGFNAVMVTDTAHYRNRNYHMKSDTIETIDFKRMTLVVTGLYTALVEL